MASITTLTNGLKKLQGDPAGAGGAALNSNFDVLDAHIGNNAKHREINDSGTSVTTLWSSNKIQAAIDAAVVNGGGGGGGELVEDETPQLGGDLELNGFAIGSATASDLTKLSQITVNASEVNYLNGTTSSVQSQLDAKAASSHQHVSGDVEYANSGYPSLDSVQAALDSLLYVSPNIASLTNNIGTVEVGQTVNALTLNWSYNKTMTSASFNQGVGSIDPSLTSLSLTSLGLTSTTNYTLTAGDGQETANRSTSALFRHKRHHGTSASASLDSSGILSLTNNQFATSRAQTVSLNGNGQYLYFAYPVSFGQASFRVNGLQNTDWIQSTVSHTNGSGHTENYYVYRSSSVQNGTGISIEVY